MPDDTVRAMMTVRANVLATGRTGVRLETLDALVAMLNAGVVPRVPEEGSVGACGDLAPLAHMAGALIGVGEVRINGSLVPAAIALKEAGIEPVRLAPKEGLALINGTHLMTASGALALCDIGRLQRAAVVAVFVKAGGNTAWARTG